MISSDKIRPLGVKLFQWLVLALFFLMAPAKWIVPALIVSVCIISLIVYSGSIKKHLRQKERMVMVLLFVLYLLSLLYSDDLQAGLFDIETKLSLLALPLLFYIPSQMFSPILKAFRNGVVVVCLVCLGSAAYRYFQGSSGDTFFYLNFSILMHPSYLAMYISLATAITFKGFREGKPERRIVQWLIHGLFLLTIILLSSKTGLLTYLLVIAYNVMQGGKKWLKAGLAILVLIVVLALIMLTGSGGQSSLWSRLQILGRESAEPSTMQNSRVVIWSSALDAIAENPVLGVGTGDVDAHLMEQYESRKFTLGEDLELNTHNQFLQTQLATGIPGTLVLIALFYFLLRHASTHRALQISFLLIVVLNAMTESILETQAGVVFFVLFYLLFTTEIETFSGPKKKAIPSSNIVI